MATCSNVSNRANSMDFNQNMPLSECMCPICMSILVEPVTLPCKHELCMPCFRMNIHETSMTCPMCRIRIATWSRQASRKNSLVNQKRWNQIKRLFPEQVNKRLAGIDEDDLLREAAVTPALSEPGEIRKEYEEEVKKLGEERELQRQAELEASEALIRQLQEEENQLKESWKKRKTKQVELDEVVAKDMAESLNELPTRLMRSRKKGSMDKFVVRSPPGTKDKFVVRSPPGTKAEMDDDEPSTSREETDTKPDKPSTSKSRSPFVDFFQPRMKPKSVDSIGSGSNGAGEGGALINFVTTDCVQTDVESRVRPKTDSLSKGKSSESDVVPKGKSSKSSDTEKVVRSFVDKNKLCQPGTSKETQVSKADRPVCKRADSTDSISQELVHFQPIQACPRTPPKRMPSGRMIHAPVIKCKPLNLPSPEPQVPAELTSKSEHHSPVIRRQVALLEAQRLAKVDKQSKAEQTDTNILHNRSPSSPFRTISIGQKRRHGIEKSPATKKLRFDLGGSDISDLYNVGNSQMVNCLRKKLDKPEVIIIDSESTQSSCIIIEEKSTMKPQQNGAFQKTAEWLDSMGDENNSENSDGCIDALKQKREPAPVYVMANRVKFNPPRDSPAVSKNVDDWLRKSQAENGDQSNDPLHVNPIDTARRCFSNPGRTILPEMTREYVLKRASEGEDRSKSVSSVLREQSENHHMIRPNKIQPATLFKGKKVPNKDKPKTRNQKTRNSKPKNTKGKSKAKSKGKVKQTNHRVISPTSGEEAGAESEEDSDLKLARKLQKQFDMEAKSGMILYKGRGTAEDYSFRKRVQKSESSS